MTRRDFLIVATAAVWLFAGVAWWFPVTGGAAVDRALAHQVIRSQAMTYRDLISDYEAIVGQKGSWTVERTGSDFLWEVNYLPSGIGSRLWFGVKTRIDSVYMNDISPSVIGQMKSVIAEHGQGRREGSAWRKVLE